jgi:hypothetical protein
MNEDMMQIMKRVGMAGRYAVPSHRRNLTVVERISLGNNIQLFIEKPSATLWATSNALDFVI